MTFVSCSFVLNMTESPVKHHISLCMLLGARTLGVGETGTFSVSKNTAKGPGRQGKHEGAGPPVSLKTATQLSPRQNFLLHVSELASSEWQLTARLTVFYTSLFHR